MKNSKKNNNTSIIIIAISAVLFIIIAYYLNYKLLICQTQEERGTFGDMFGASNALFSGLALAGIIITILLQKSELKYQRLELRKTKKEFKIQNLTLKLQRFENTFFSLLNLHHQIVSEIDFTYYKNKEKTITKHQMHSVKIPPPEDKEIITIKGRDVFRYKYKMLSDVLKTNPEDFNKLYIEYYPNAQTDFGHYFRNLYRMVKLVHETDFFYNKEKVSDEDIFKLKYKYTSIIRAQLSDFELLWLFYNCLSDNGREKFKKYLEEYSLLKNLPKNYLVDINHLKEYDSKAFEPI